MNRTSRRRIMCMDGTVWVAAIPTVSRSPSPWRPGLDPDHPWPCAATPTLTLIATLILTLTPSLTLSLPLNHNPNPNPDPNPPTLPNPTVPRRPTRQGSQNFRMMPRRILLVTSSAASHPAIGVRGPLRRSTATMVPSTCRPRRGPEAPAAPPTSCPAFKVPAPPDLFRASVRFP